MPNVYFRFNTLHSLLILYLHIMESKIYTLGSGAVGTIEVLEAPSLPLKQRVVNWALRPYIHSLYVRFDAKFKALAKRVSRRPLTGDAMTDQRLNEFELKWLTRGFLRFRWRRWAISRYCADYEDSRLADTIHALQEWNNTKKVYEALRLLEERKEVKL